MWKNACLCALLWACSGTGGTECISGRQIAGDGLVSLESADVASDGRAGATVTVENGGGAVRVSVDCLFFDRDGYYAGEGRTVATVCESTAAQILIAPYAATVRPVRAHCSLALP